MKQIEATPISGALGAEITGVDLRGPLDDATAAEIRQALLDHVNIRCTGVGALDTSGTVC